MSTPHRTPVYKCIIPVEQSPSVGSSSYHSLFKNGAQKFPYLAWPYIEDANRPCCLPTLFRAIYLVPHPAPLGPKSIEAKAREYLARQANMEPEVREGALAIVKAYQKSLSEFTKILHRFLPDDALMEQMSIFSDPVSFPLPDDESRYIGEIIEQSMQALIYGSRDHFMGPKDAFSFGHEYVHRIALKFDSGKELEALAYDSHIWLTKLAIIEELSPEQIDELWEEFEKTRERIDDLVQKFEPVEEIFATYLGMRFLPVDIRNNIEPLVNEELKKRKWDKVYEAFVEECDGDGYSFDAAIYICDEALLMLRHIEMDGLEFLRTFLKIHKLIMSTCGIILEELKQIKEKEIEQIYTNAPDGEKMEFVCWLVAFGESMVCEGINRLLEDAHIPLEIYWSASQTLHDTRKERAKLITEAFRNNDFSDLNHRLHTCTPKTMMIGSLMYKYIQLFTSYCKHEGADENEILYLERVFYESLGEQILHNKRLRCEAESDDDRTGTAPNSILVCPFGSIEYRKGCCGRREELERLHERIPEKYRKHILLPKCVRAC